MTEEDNLNLNGVYLNWGTGTYLHWKLDQETMILSHKYAKCNSLFSIFCGLLSNRCLHGGLQRRIEKAWNKGGL